jgi:hypothetical protein
MREGGGGVIDGDPGRGAKARLASHRCAARRARGSEHSSRRERDRSGGDGTEGSAAPDAIP